MSGLVARRGALLPMMLVVMVIIALSASAALFAARQERRSTWNTRLGTSALSVADGALAEVRGELAGIAHMLSIGASVVRASPVASDVAATTTLTRLGPTLFLLGTDAVASSPQGLSARRRLSLLLQLDAPAIELPAALGVIGAAPPEIGVADGLDEAPGEWPCDPPRSDTAPIRHPSPPPDSSILAALRSRSAIRLPAGAVLRGVGPVVRDGACATERADNWGDPSRTGACGPWLPVVHAAGDLTVDGGTGQGTLLVDGDLSVSGGFRFTGAVIVNGTIGIGTGGASLLGGVITMGIIVPPRSGNDPPIVHRSSCAVAAALLAAGALGPVADRAWASVR